jgi:uncharacterized protein
MVLPPASRIGPMTAEERRAAIAASPIAGHYEKLLDRESAYEKLTSDANEKVGAGDTAPQVATTGTAPAEPAAAGGGLLGGFGDVLFGSTGPRGGQRDGLAQTMAKTVVRTIGSQVGREIMRGVLGSIMGGRRR